MSTYLISPAFWVPLLIIAAHLKKWVSHGQRYCKTSVAFNITIWYLFDDGVYKKLSLVKGIEVMEKIWVFNRCTFYTFYVQICSITIFYIKAGCWKLSILKLCHCGPWCSASWATLKFQIILEKIYFRSSRWNMPFKLAALKISHNHIESPQEIVLHIYHYRIHQT